MKYTGIRNPRGSGAVESESVTSREVSINEGRPLTTDYDDALEEQRLQALSNDTEKDSLPEESPSFCDRMLPKTRAGRLTLTVISILIVVAICIIAVFLTFGNSNSNSASGSSTGPDYTLIPTSTPILIPTSPPTRGSDSLSPTSNDDSKYLKRYVVIYCYLFTDLIHTRRNISHRSHSFFLHINNLTNHLVDSYQLPY